MHGSIRSTISSPLRSRSQVCRAMSPLPTYTTAP
jgi:hypothetical protein